MNKTITTALIALGMLGFGAGAANATAPDPITIVAWTVTDPADRWAVPQVLFTSTTLVTPDLAALDAALVCQPTDVTYQVDQYNTGPITDALLAVGLLFGPNNPQEDLIPGGDGVAYKLITVPACVVPPVVVPPVVEPPVVVPPVEAPVVETVDAPAELALTAERTIGLKGLALALVTMGVGGLLLAFKYRSNAVTN